VQNSVDFGLSRYPGPVFYRSPAHHARIETAIGAPAEISAALKALAKELSVPSRCGGSSYCQASYVNDMRIFASPGRLSRTRTQSFSSSAKGMPANAISDLEAEERPYVKHKPSPFNWLNM
jgi:hypothetical protein